VALLYVMLLIGMVGGSVIFGVLLSGTYTHLRLIQVIQGAAVVTLVLNVIAMWQQEPRDPSRAAPAATAAQPPRFGAAWREFTAPPSTRRLLAALGFGTAAFSMQDVLLEPYGGQILGMPVGATSLLTALYAGGALVAFGLASRTLRRGGDPLRVAAHGALVGVLGFAAVVFADPLQSPMLFRLGAVLIGFGGGLFSVGTLLAAMSLRERDNGLALGAWGAVQATAGGLAIAGGGAACNALGALATSGALGPALASPATGYMFVYHLEIALLFAALVAIGPLVRVRRTAPGATTITAAGAAGRPAGRGDGLGLAEMPG
jgi:BCD family chlorophyll transporter-like MFS transporter